MGRRASTEMTHDQILTQRVWKMYTQGIKASCIVAEAIGLEGGLMQEQAWDHSQQCGAPTLGGMSNALPDRPAQRETSRQVRECAAAEPLNKAVTPFSVTFSHPARDKDSKPSLLPAFSGLYRSGAKTDSQTS